jgi:hypothetical protein
MKRILAVTLSLILSHTALITSGFANEIKHTENIRVGQTNVRLDFTDFPVRHERSLDITFAPDGGITGKTATVNLIGPNKEFISWLNPNRETKPLPRFPRDRSMWGLDSIAMVAEGTWMLELTIDGQSARVPLEVLARPDGPTNNQILLLAMLPFVGLIVVATRGWMRLQPTRHVAAKSW